MARYKFYIVLYCIVSKTADITKDDITLQLIGKMSLCCEVISSIVIFAVLDLRVGGCCP